MSLLAESNWIMDIHASAIQDEFSRFRPLLEKEFRRVVRPHCNHLTEAQFTTLSRAFWNDAAELSRECLSYHPHAQTATEKANIVRAMWRRLFKANRLTIKDLFDLYTKLDP